MHERRQPFEITTIFYTQVSGLRTRQHATPSGVEFRLRINIL